MPWQPLPTLICHSRSVLALGCSCAAASWLISQASVYEAVKQVGGSECVHLLLAPEYRQVSWQEGASGPLPWVSRLHSPTQLKPYSCSLPPALCSLPPCPLPQVSQPRTRGKQRRTLLGQVCSPDSASRAASSPPGTGCQLARPRQRPGERNNVLCVCWHLVFLE